VLEGHTGRASRAKRLEIISAALTQPNHEREEVHPGPPCEASACFGLGRPDGFHSLHFFEKGMGGGTTSWLFSICRSVSFNEVSVISKQPCACGASASYFLDLRRPLTRRVSHAAIAFLKSFSSAAVSTFTINTSSYGAVAHRTMGKGATDLAEELHGHHFYYEPQFLLGPTIATALRMAWSRS
jgi:hypothetical protein